MSPYLKVPNRKFEHKSSWCFSSKAPAYMRDCCASSFLQKLLQTATHLNCRELRMNSKQLWQRCTIQDCSLASSSKCEDGFQAEPNIHECSLSSALTLSALFPPALFLLAVRFHVTSCIVDEKARPKRAPAIKHCSGVCITIPHQSLWRLLAGIRRPCATIRFFSSLPSSR